MLVVTVFVPRACSCPPSLSLSVSPRLVHVPRACHCVCPQGMWLGLSLGPVHVPLWLCLSPGPVHIPWACHCLCPQGLFNSPEPVTVSVPGPVHVPRACHCLSPGPVCVPWACHCLSIPRACSSPLSLSRSLSLSPGPVITTEMRETVEQTTTDTLALHYTEETGSGTFDHYIFTLQETPHVHPVIMDRGDLDRKVMFHGLQPGHKYWVMAQTVSGAERSTTKRLKIFTGTFLITQG